MNNPDVEKLKKRIDQLEKCLQNVVDTMGLALASDLGQREKLRYYQYFDTIRRVILKQK